MIVVPQLAPAAAQMMLDLAALRRRDVKNIPVVLHGSDIKVGPPLTGWAPSYVSVKGNPAAARQTATLFDNPVRWAALLKRYRHRIIHSVGEDPVLHAMGHGAALMHLTDLRVPQRPVLVVDDLDASLVSAIPHARLLGALVVPLDEAASVLPALEPAEVYATDVARHRLPVGAWRVLPLPGRAGGHGARLPAAGAAAPRRPSRQPRRDASAPARQPSAPGGDSPAEYVVLSALDPAQRQFAFLAANYAAALQAPLFLMPKTDETLRRHPRAGRAPVHRRGDPRGDPRRPDERNRHGRHRAAEPLRRHIRRPPRAGTPIRGAGLVVCRLPDRAGR